MPHEHNSEDVNLNKIGNDLVAHAVLLFISRSVVFFFVHVLDIALSVSYCYMLF